MTRIVYSIDSGVRQTYSAPFSIPEAGEHSVEYWAENAIGNVAPSKTGYVRIDAAGPSCVPLNRVAIRPRAKATFRYRLTDPAPSCGLARATVFIYHGRRLVRSLRAEFRETDATYRLSRTLVLPRGRYVWRAGAVDAVGNVAAKSRPMPLRIQ